MAKPRPQPIPDRDKLDKLARRALTHARTKLASAEVLLATGDWPTAHATATLAFEEVGKAMLCLVSMATPERERVNDWFWPAFNNHRPKLTIARFVLDIIIARFSAEPTPSEPFVQAIEKLVRWPTQITQGRCAASTSTTTTATCSTPPTSRKTRLVA